MRHPHDPHRSTFAACGLSVLAAFAAPGGLAAEEATGTLGVTALVASSCTVVATPIGFATLTTGADTNESVAGTVQMLCSANQTGVTLVLDGGTSASGGQRRMESSGAFLPYDLFSDGTRSSAVPIGGTLYSGALSAATPTTVSVYGTVPSGSYQTGAYSDSVGITLTYE